MMCVVSTRTVCTWCPSREHGGIRRIFFFFLNDSVNHSHFNLKPILILYINIRKKKGVVLRNSVTFFFIIYIFLLHWYFATNCFIPPFSVMFWMFLVRKNIKHWCKCVFGGPKHPSGLRPQPRPGREHAVSTRTENSGF